MYDRAMIPYCLIQKRQFQVSFQSYLDGGYAKLMNTSRDYTIWWSRYVTEDGRTGTSEFSDSLH